MVAIGSGMMWFRTIGADHMTSKQSEANDRKSPARLPERGDRAGANPDINPESHPELAPLVRATIQKLTDAIAIAPPPTNPEILQQLSALFALLLRLERLIHQNAQQLAKGNKPKLQSALESLTLNVSATIDLLEQKKDRLDAYVPFVGNVVWDVRAQIRSLERPIFGKLQNLLDGYLRNTDVPTKILTGLILALPLYFYAPRQLQSNLTQIGQIAEQQETHALSSFIVASFVVGSSGSMISILMRFSDYQQDKDRDRPPYDPQYIRSVVPVFVGLFKPLIGGTFGIFVYAILSTGILPIELLDSNDTGTNKYWLTLIAATFATGFSERFAKDLVARTEKTLGMTENQAGDRPAALPVKVSPELPQEERQDRQNEEKANESPTNAPKT